MFNFNDPRNRKTASAIIIIIVVVAMVGGMVVGSLAMFH